MKWKHIHLLVFLALVPGAARAQVRITEIMYDPAGANTGREWIEIQNDDHEDIDLSTWRLFEGGSNHKLTPVDSQKMLKAGSYAVIVDNVAKFSADYPDTAAHVFDSSFSLKNTGDSVALKDADLNTIDTVTFMAEDGGSDDGTTLIRVDGHFVSGKPTPGEENDEAAGEPDEPTEVPTSSHSDSSSTASTPASTKSEMLEPTFKAKIISQPTAVTGAYTLFSGSASGFTGQPLMAERYLWNFGDGAVGEGESIRHIYRYPGMYVLTLDVSSGKFSVSARREVKVIPATVGVVETVPGPEGYVEVSNDSAYELDISSWELSLLNRTFMFPERTLILPKSQVRFPASITGLVAPPLISAALLFPNHAAVPYTSNTSVHETSTPALSATMKSPAASPASQRVSGGVPRVYAAERMSSQKIEEPLSAVPPQPAAPVEKTSAHSEEHPLGWVGGLAIVLLIASSSIVFVSRRAHTTTNSIRIIDVSDSSET